MPAKGTLIAHCGSERVTLKQLERVITPDRTKTWTPTPHIEVPRAIRSEIQRRDWTFAESDPHKIWDISLTPDKMKMFGVTKVTIPGVSGLFDDFGFAIGFRNSHNKTLSLRLSMGTCVFVCDNLMMTGDFDVRREHTRRIKTIDVVTRALDLVAENAARLGDRFLQMREVELPFETGITMLADAVEAQALPIGSFMEARHQYRQAFLHNPVTPVELEQCNAGLDEADRFEILHGKALWGWYQSITGTWKGKSLMRVPHYSKRLNELVKDRYGLDLAA